MLMKKRFTLLFCIAAALIALSFTRPADRYFEIAKNLDIFATLFKEVNALYVDEVNPNKLVRTGIDAMLASLDPYTNYIPEDEVEDYRTMNTGQYGGIGAITREIEKRTVVTMIIEGYQAQKGGLKIGDGGRILADVDHPSSILYSRSYLSHHGDTEKSKENQTDFHDAKSKVPETRGSRLSCDAASASGSVRANNPSDCSDLLSLPSPCLRGE